jgi:DNA-binding XRE family transcriptional regulator
MTDSEIRNQIGNNLRFLRTRTFKECKNKKGKVVMRPLTQTELAQAINVTFQQIQKYENGINQVSSVKLYKFYRFFQIPLEYFFDKRLIENQNFTKLIKENVQQNNL